MKDITPFLMFAGQAEEAVHFYVSLFPNSEIKSITRYGDNDAGPAGTLEHAVFSLGGRSFLCIDSPVQHAFTFTPAISLYVTCDTEEEINALVAKLAEGGRVFMPLAEYPFSRKFAWLNDRFGVSWPLTLMSA